MSDTLIDNSKPVIIFDGDCRFCIARVDNIRNLDSTQQFNYLPRQDQRTEEIFPHLKNIDLEEGLLFVEPDGSTAVGADAFYHIARRLPGFSRVAWVYHIPLIKQLIQLGYWIVARNRKRLGQTCLAGACRLPPNKGTEAPR